jgi:acetyl-CoA carboxylase biotin carboxylase subunit
MDVANDMGYPILIKAAAGGGGRGIKIVTDGGELPAAFAAAAAEARGAFGDETLYMERYISNARHIEVQVLGDSFGNVVHIGERDCSLQRRYQKVLEEAPAYSIPENLREDMRTAAIAIARNTNYENAGTVEFIADQDRGSFYFLEMNTRIQVEHPVTEMISGIDLVQEQIRIAGGQRLAFSQSDIKFSGHAIECRINAESPRRGFLPGPGKIAEWRPPEGPDIRVDSHCRAGTTVSPYYDSLLAKLIVRGDDRVKAIGRMQEALADFSVSGVETTIPFQRAMVCRLDYIRGATNTRWLENNLQELVERI